MWKNSLFNSGVEKTRKLHVKNEIRTIFQNIYRNKPQMR